MLSTTATLLLTACLTLSADVEGGRLLIYQGEMAPLKDDGQPGKKTFELQLLLPRDGIAAEGATTIGWTLAEQGRGRGPWLARFGLWQVTPQGRQGMVRDEASTGPALWYERPTGRGGIPLAQPLFAADKSLTADAAWNEGNWQFSVKGDQSVLEQAGWVVDSRTPIGFARQLIVAKDSPLVLKVHETLFVGQGEQQSLTWELTKRETLSLQTTQTIVALLEDLTKLREGLELRPTAAGDLPLSDKALAKLRAELPSLVERGAKTPLSPLLTEGQKETQAQKGRAGAIAALREAAVGKAVEKVTLTNLAGKTVSTADWAGKVVVLHFWEYRDLPLEEPYGQVGYLDFLARQSNKAGKGEVLVLGVHVDERLADEEGRRASVAGAKKLLSFMNLGYPVLLDQGSFLATLGDARKSGAKLPLWVVIGKDGKVAEYRAGLYDVKAQQGLTELAELVEKLR